MFGFPESLDMFDFTPVPHPSYTVSLDITGNKAGRKIDSRDIGPLHLDLKHDDDLHVHLLHVNDATVDSQLG